MAVAAAAAWYEELREVEYREEANFKKIGSISKRLAMDKDLSEEEVGRLKEERTALREEVHRLVLEMSPQPDFSCMTEAERAEAAERVRSIEVKYGLRLMHEGDPRGQSIQASARIVDFDPKQGGLYYSRYTRGDLIRFNLDEECKSLARGTCLAFPLFQFHPSFCMFCMPPTHPLQFNFNPPPAAHLCCNRYVTMCN